MGRPRSPVTATSGLPTMDDVARHAGVSRALVSLAFRDSPRVSAASRERISEAARSLGYRPNAAARQLASKGTGTIGILLNDLQNPFFTDVYEGVQEAAEQFGYRLLLTTGRHRDAGEQAAIDTMVEHRVDGMVLASIRVTERTVVEAARLAPLTVVGRRVHGPNVDSVMSDEPEGVRLAVGHLVELGHRHIVHVDGGRGAGARPRRAAFVDEMERHGLTAEVIPGDFTEDSGVRAAEALLRRPRLPTAVFAANDLVALGVMATLEGAGVSVPSDVSIVGYDNTHIAALRHVSLTTVDQPRAEIGRSAIRLVHQRVDGSRSRAHHEQVTPSLVVRRTTAPPRPSPRP